jgi:hypothetical protein
MNEPWQGELTKVLRRADMERLRVIVDGREYDVPIPVGRELEESRQYADALANLVGDLAALIPISETIDATKDRASMVQWFKDHLKR